MKAIVCAVAVAAFCVVSSAVAEPPVPKKCLNPENDTSFSECGTPDIQQLDSRLSAAWFKALECFTPEQQNARQALIESERRWIQWKEKACDYYNEDRFEGDAGPGRIAQCTAVIVAEQAKRLEDLGGECKAVSKPAGQ